MFNKITANLEKITNYISFFGINKVLDIIMLKYFISKEGHQLNGYHFNQYYILINYISKTFCQVEKCAAKFWKLK